MNEKKAGKSMGLDIRTLILGFVFLLFIICLFFFLQTEAVGILVLSSLYIVSVVPKEGMILGVVAMLRTQGLLFAVGFTTVLAVFLDAFLALVVLLQYNSLMKIAFIQNLVNRFSLKISRNFRNDWKLFLFLFHLVPLQGFGPLVTTILGKILKVESSTVFYIVISGTAITTFLFSLLFFYGISLLPEEYFYVVAVIVILLPAIITASRFLAEKSQSKSSPPM